MRINHNISALNTYRQLTANNTATSASLQKLSSGLRINSAADDAAGLAISEKMRGQIRGLDQATSNANDGISLIQTAEGALNETHSILQRMRELAVQSANDTNTDADRAEIQKEIEQLTSEITRISTDTQFNTKNLVDGSMEAKVISANPANIDDLKVAAGATVESGTYHVTISEYVAGVEAQPASAVKAEVTNGALVTDEVYTYHDGAWYDAADTEMTDADLALIGLKFSGSAQEGAVVTTAARSTLTGTAAHATGSTTVTGTPGTTAVAWNNAQAQTGLAAAIAASMPGAVAYGETPNTVTVTFTYDGAAWDGAVNGVVNGALDNVTPGNMTTSYGATITGASAGAVITVALTGAENDGTAEATAVPTQTAKIEGTEATYKTVITDPAGNNASSALFDFDFGAAYADSTFTVDVDASNALTFHIGANSGQNTKLNMNNMNAESLGIDKLDLTTQQGADAAITTIDDAITTVSAQRAALGAMQNRLEHTINNLSTTSENLTASESQIRDVDMAKEMMEYTKNNILSQAAQSMLAQANQQPQQVLQLLQG